MKYCEYGTRFRKIKNPFIFNQIHFLFFKNQQSLFSQTQFKMFLIFAKKIAKIRHYFFNSYQKQHFHEYFPLKLQIKVILIDTKSTT
jgi:hypothetical protein